MASASPAETSSSQGGDQVEHTTTKPATKASRQRFKPQLSCTSCRTRKLKCDRNLPCHNCVKRDLAASCSYIHAGVRRDKPSSVQKASSNSKDIQSQITHLEELVVSLMNKSNNVGTSSRTDSSAGMDENNSSPQLPQDCPWECPEDTWTEINSVKDTTESVGLISLRDDNLGYVGGSHWEAILDNIACLKDSLGSTECQQETKEIVAQSDHCSPDLLVGTARRCTRTEIIGALPPKRLADQLVEHYFSNPDCGCPMIHLPTFLKIYEKFWADPSSAPMMWISILFSVLCLATQLEMMQEKKSVLVGSPDVALYDVNEIIDLYREKAVQCLIMGNYTEPGPNTIEALVLYYATEHFRSTEMEMGLWMVLGLIIRAAMRLGLHRDASHYPKISILQGEMQRRLWASIVYLDIISSCQVGLPRMIKENMYDTQRPRDLLDEDLTEDTKILPPSRPYSDFTPCAYLNNKQRVGGVLGMIVDQSNSIDPIPYGDAMKLDYQLNEILRQTPAHLKIDKIEDLSGCSTDMIIRRFITDMMFQKAKCILHRKFFVLSKGTYPYPYSMNTCVEASVRVLQYQIYMHKETRPGRPLRDQKWKISYLMAYDYLLAAMLLCLYLGHGMVVESLPKPVPQNEIRVKWTREEVLGILDESYQIFVETRLSSRASLKAAGAMKAMLAKVRAPSVTPAAKKPRQTAESTTSTAESTTSGISNQTPFSTPVEPSPSTSAEPISQQEQALDMSGPCWIQAPAFGAGCPNSNINTLQPPSDMNEALFGNMELDWEVWDSQFYHHGASQTPPDLFNLDPNLPFPDPNANFMQWEQQS